MKKTLEKMEYPELKSWLDSQLVEFYGGLLDNKNTFTDRQRLNYLYNLWVDDESADDCRGLRENLEVLELLDAHIKFNYPDYIISDNGRLKMLYNLIREGNMKVLSYRIDDI